MGRVILAGGFLAGGQHANGDPGLLGRPDQRNLLLPASDFRTSALASRQALKSSGRKALSRGTPIEIHRHTRLGRTHGGPEHALSLWRVEPASGKVHPGRKGSRSGGPQVGETAEGQCCHV
jgi:hypothetical protein